MIHVVRSRIADTLLAALPAAIIALATMILLRFPPAQHGFYPRCPVHELLHLQCPGCGATRAVAALLHGRVTEAMNLNALVTLLLPFAAGYGIFCYCRLPQRKIMRWPQLPPALIYSALIMGAVFTVIRNLPFPSF
jgi:Protein of unknown function (DUF2752)